MVAVPVEQVGRGLARGRRARVALVALVRRAAALRTAALYTRSTPHRDTRHTQARRARDLTRNPQDTSQIEFKISRVKRCWLSTFTDELEWVFPVGYL